MTTPVIHPKILDLSHYDDLQDVAKVKAFGIRGIVNKVTEGPGLVDTTFAARRAVVLGAGLFYGAYHFLRPGDMAQQAQHFLNAVGDPKGLLLMGDWEVTNVTPDLARQWFGAVHDKVGRWPVLYSYSAMLLQLLGTAKPDAVLVLTRLWLAAYNTDPKWPKQIWPRYWAWQFTGDGNGPGPHQIPGVVLPGSKGIDVDSYEGGDLHFVGGDDAELAAEWSGEARVAATAPTPEQTPPHPETPAPAGNPLERVLEEIFLHKKSEQ